MKNITGLHHPYGIAISNEGDIVVIEKVLKLLYKDSAPPSHGRGGTDCDDCHRDTDIFYFRILG